MVCPQNQPVRPARSSRPQLPDDVPVRPGGPANSAPNIHAGTVHPVILPGPPKSSPAVILAAPRTTPALIYGPAKAPPPHRPRAAAAPPRQPKQPPAAGKAAAPHSVAVSPLPPLPKLPTAAQNLTLTADPAMQASPPRLPKQPPACPSQKAPPPAREPMTFMEKVMLAEKVAK